MKIFRRGFVVAATLLPLFCPAIRAQTTPVAPHEPVPTLDIQGVNNASARRLLKRAFELPGRLWNPILSPTGKQLVCANFLVNTANFYILSLVNDRIEIKKVYDPFEKNFGSYETGTEREKQFFRVGSANAFSPDGNIFATGSYGTRDNPVNDSIQLWDTRTWRKIGVLKGHSHTVVSIVFSPDGKKIISGDKGSGALIHDVASRAIDAAWYRVFYSAHDVIAAFWNDHGALIPIAIVRKKFANERIGRELFYPPREAIIKREKVSVAPETPFGDFEIWNLQTNRKIQDLDLPADDIMVNEAVEFSDDGRVMALLTASKAELFAESTPADAAPYRATLIAWTTYQINDIKLTSPLYSDFATFYICLHFVPGQNAVLLCDTPADRLTTFDVSALTESPTSAR